MGKDNWSKLKIFFIMLLIILIGIIITTKISENVELNKENNQTVHKNNSLLNQTINNRYETTVPTKQNITTQNTTQNRYNITLLYLYTDPHDSDCGYCKQGKDELEHSNLENEFNGLIIQTIDINKNQTIKDKYVTSGEVLAIPAYIILMNNKTISINGYVSIENVEFMICLYLEDRPEKCNENEYMKKIYEMSINKKD